jgi:pimeloyl-ACP methyl ester carboxylesterase
VQVSYQGVASNPFQVIVTPSSPGIFSATASGSGQAAMTNADGSANSSGHPATPGSYVTFYLTGVGQTSPPSSDGNIAIAAANAALPVSVTIGGIQAQVLYAGAAPGAVDGFSQINAVVPFGLASGNLPLNVQISGAFSQSGITVAVAGTTAPAKRAIVLVHGIGQTGTDMHGLENALANPLYGVDPSRFVFESTPFSWTCATQGFLSCPSYCSIEEGATELANHIASLPAGHIILVAYSMGGLLARDLILNNPNQILTTHPVDALVTLGTPNVGYPGESLIDDFVFCPALVSEMTSDYRSQQAQNTVLESPYLLQLNNAWTTHALPAPNLQWLAIAGTFCSNPIRDSVFNTGCRDVNPYNDGAVCADSATFILAGINQPTVRWSSPLYAHTNDPSLNFLAPAGCNDVQNYSPLFQPPVPSPLLQELVAFINAR